MSKTFGTRLAEERKKQKKSAEIIAKDCGTILSDFQLIEKAKRLPDKKLLPKIAAALNLKTLVVLNWYLEDVRQKFNKI